MAERSIIDELIYKLNYLLKKKKLDSSLHSKIIDAINLGDIDLAKSMVDPIFFDFQNDEIENINGEPDKKRALSREIIKSNEMISFLSQENANLKGQQRIDRHELEIAVNRIKKKEKEIKILSEENKELKEKTQQLRIDENISNYVDSVKNKLNSDDDFFIKMSHLWSSCGAFFCVCAIVAAFFTFKTGVDTLLKNEDLNSISLFYLFTRGLLGIGLLSWLSYTCFNNSRRYTHESIRRKDRQHALMFGQIFLQIFGGTASKEDAIHVFKDWNMSGDTAFSGKTEQPPSVHGVLAQIKNMLPTKSDKASESNKKEDDN